MKNPFEFGRELGVEEIVDRDAEIDEVVRTIGHGGKLFMVGPRRYGKTSILKSAEQRLQSGSAVVLRYDAESYPSLDLLVNDIVADAAKHLKGSVERAGEQIRRFFVRLRPELNFSINEKEWTAKIGLTSAEQAGSHLPLLVNALDGLEELARAQPKSRAVGLIVDEFQRIIEIGGPEAEGHIRAAIQRHKRTGYVFSGSKTRLMTTMTTDAGRPFYRLGILRFIGPVPRRDFISFLQRKFSESHFEIEDAALELILSLSEEVPYNVQMLAHTCWELLREVQDKATLTQNMVEQSLERLVRQYDPFYTQLWNGLTSIQQKTLRLAVTERGINLQSTKVSQALGKGPATIRKSLAALISRSILREEEQDGRLKIRFEDPFFARWIELFTAAI
jgi:uncharacterized protein